MVFGTIILSIGCFYSLGKDSGLKDFQAQRTYRPAVETIHTLKASCGAALAKARSSRVLEYWRLSERRTDMATVP